MSDADTLNQSEEQIEEQNTNAEEETNEQEQLQEESQDTSTDDSDADDSTEDEDIDDSEDKPKEPTTEELNALSDDEFTEYLETGKLPKKTQETQNAKIISKPEPSPKQESKPKSESKTQTSSNDSKSASKQSTESKGTNTGIDYENAYKAIFKPFKANGKEITPRTVEDVISLMQMGANYTKKMQLMAPMKKAVESLNRANIGEDDLSFLIDVHNGDKEAIKQLLQKHKIDPLDMNMDEESAYVSNKKNIATDKDVEFSDALLEANDSLPKIREILDTKWDAESKNKILKDPRLMTALHEEIQLNRFDKVQEVLEREKMFGRYKGVSDVEAYIDIVTKMVEQESKKQQQATQQQTKQESKPAKPIPDKNKAAPTRTKTNNGKSTLTAQDIWNMSEEEFNKLSAKDLV